VVALAAAAILVVIGAWLRSRALREVRLSGLVAQGGVKA
jgi:hypothetical protein